MNAGLDLEVVGVRSGDAGVSSAANGNAVDGIGDSVVSSKSFREICVEPLVIRLFFPFFPTFSLEINKFQWAAVMGSPPSSTSVSPCTVRSQSDSYP